MANTGYVSNRVIDYIYYSLWKRETCLEHPSVSTKKSVHEQINKRNTPLVKLIPYSRYSESKHERVKS